MHNIKIYFTYGDHCYMIPFDLEFTNKTTTVLCDAVYENKYFKLVFIYR